MSIQNDQGSETYECVQCGSTWIAPSRLSLEWWNELAAALGGVIPQVGALEWLKDNTDASEATRKTIVGHLCVIEDRCVNCGNALPGKGPVKCPSCKATALNYVAGDSTEKR